MILAKKSMRNSSPAIVIKKSPALPADLKKHINSCRSSEVFPWEARQATGAPLHARTRTVARWRAAEGARDIVDTVLIRSRFREPCHTKNRNKRHCNSVVDWIPREYPHSYPFFPTVAFFTVSTAAGFLTARFALNFTSTESRALL